MVMNNLTKEDKKIFFEDIHEIKNGYDLLVRNNSFAEAEKYKRLKIKEHILKNSKKLIDIRERLYGSK